MLNKLSWKWAGVWRLPGEAVVKSGLEVLEHGVLVVKPASGINELFDFSWPVTQPLKLC